MKLDLAYPHFSWPNYEEIKSRGNQRQYSDYVSHLLYTLGAVLEVSTDPAWIASIEYYIDIHKTYLKEENIVENGAYVGELKEIIKRKLAVIPPERPD